eukprot:TRINITY_DN2689_c0_g1_i5.p1 TRINITY_DN2689_c0_g1~~TRINITY_DN2689_c0_g1_i5.p1  ORF type:complete len:375 (-),score=53.49 TRINITY_DN2689_c0_g1_i5:115-1239(-)
MPDRLPGAFENARKARSFDFHQNFVLEILLYFYVAGLFYVIYSFYRVCRRRQTSRRYSKSLNKLYLLNICIGLIFLTRLGISVARILNFGMKTLKLFQTLDMIVEPLPNVLAITAYSILSYLFYTLHQNLLHFYEENRSKLRKTRFMLSALSISLLVGFALLATGLIIFKSKMDKTFIFSATRIYSILICFVGATVLTVITLRLISCVRDISVLSGKEFPIGRFKLLMATAIASQVIKGLFILFRVLSKWNSSFYVALSLKTWFPSLAFNYGEGYMYISVLIYYFFYYFALEFLPCMYIAFRLSPGMQLKEVTDSPPRRDSGGSDKILNTENQTLFSERESILLLKDSAASILERKTGEWNHPPDSIKSFEVRQ